MSRYGTMVGASAMLAIGASCNGSFTYGPDWISGRTDCPDPSFQGQRVVVEAHRMDESEDQCWWLSSGAMFSIDSSVARTLHGELPYESGWRRLYATSNPVDTDDGMHPQNLLRLVTRAKWRDVRQEVRFRITRINVSESPERGEWSGVLLFQRYIDSDNLYYSGLRMDGNAVIKRKSNGKYVTLAQTPVFDQSNPYHRYSNPSLLPSGKWIGLASVVRNEPDGSVRITLFTRDEEGKGGWQAVLEAVDDGRHGEPIRTPGHTGLRADFMDVEFAGYSARNQ